MKKVITNLIIAFIASIIPIGVLVYGYTFRMKEITYDFERKIITPAKDVKMKNIKYNSYYFAGHLGERIYLGNYTASRHVLEVSTSLADTQSKTISVDKMDFKAKGNYNLYVDNNRFYMLNGLERSILSGDNNSWVARKDKIFVPYFTQSIPLSNSSVVYRINSAKTGYNSLRKESFLGRIDNETALKKQIDGVFCTDGKLEYNKHLGIFTYMYYYRNQVLLLDTNLNVIGKIKTIDPIDTAKFQVSKINANKASTFSSTRLLVNARCSAWNNYLFIQSKLIGKHEDENSFKTSIVIDVYDIPRGIYLYSFYLPDLNFDPIRQFKVMDGCIMTLSGNFIVKYTIKLPPMRS